MKLDNTDNYINLCKKQNLPSGYLTQVCLDHVKNLTRYDMIGVAKKLFVK